MSIPLYIFYDGLIHANISENFNLMTNFNVVALLILSDIPYFGVNEAYVDIYLHYFLFLSLPLNKETQYNTIQYIQYRSINTDFEIWQIWQSSTHSNFQFLKQGLK